MSEHLQLVLSDDEVFADAIAAEGEASGNRWRAADDYDELVKRGYKQVVIAERVGKSEGHISLCLKAVNLYLGKDRGEFQAAYDQAKSTAHLSSEKDDWATPQDLFVELDSEFGFELDVCASEANAKCEFYFSEGALEQEWKGVCWMNPPYSEIAAWLEKAYTSAVQNFATVVCLVPARTDVGWAWDWAQLGEVRLIQGRLHFVDDEGNTGPAPFPSMVVVFEHGRPACVKWWDRG